MLSNLLLVLLTLLGVSLPGGTPLFRGEKDVAAADWPPASAPGRLAYVGADGNVYVTVISHGIAAPATAITMDATTGPEGRGRSYHRIAWAHDGRLAFAAVERGSRTVRSELYVVAPDQAPQLVGAHPEHHVIYMHWAPAACTTCPDLVYLIEGENALDLRRVDITPGAVTPENRVLDDGRPFYFSWSPDGREMLWHRGGARRLNADAQLSLHDLTARRTRTLAPAPGSFLAPAWSPDGSAWLTVTEHEAGNGLLLDMAGEQTVIATGSAEIAFAWSPDGARIAYARRDGPTAPAYDAIHVYDVPTGQKTRITAPGFHPRAFFWSPTGDRLAYINWLAIPAAHWSQWRVYDFEDAAERGYPAFNPTPHLRMIIGSFNQYAQSHRFWSADGRYLLYTDRDKALTERIWVVDTFAEVREEPLFVGQGSLGVWSWAAPAQN